MGQYFRRWTCSLALLAVGWLAFVAPAAAAGACSQADPLRATTLAQRISAIACRENALWYSPFIDLEGRLASMTVVEAETSPLSDGATPAWKRVADYWRGSGQLWAMNGFPGAEDCARATSDGYPSPGCRAFVVDRPWSAAFVSYVMTQAGVPGFHASPSHIDYVREAYLRPGTSPFVFVDPDQSRPAIGDLLCYTRGAGAPVDNAALRSWLDTRSNAGLAMHCDVVVAGGASQGSRLYLVGGNVLQGVTMRMLALNRDGRIWSLPRGMALGCSPDNEAACSFNRQNWAVLLQLKPSLPMSTAVQGYDLAPTAPSTQCCTQCVVGSGVPRCPNPPAPTP